MARTALTVQVYTRAGITPTYSAANVDGHSIPNDGQTYFHIKTGGTACTVTLILVPKVDGQTPTNKTVVLGTTQERLVGPFPPQFYNQPGDEVWIDFSAVTAVTIGAFRPSSS